MDYESIAQENSEEKNLTLAEGYRQMAADHEREREAEGWTEALIGGICSFE